tara:strand:- start:974 stop:1366 length:393 start_codon:yes stop_codon:yes gene_type:complete
MKIFGIGTDIVNIKRIENIFKKRGSPFKKRIFSKIEINYCEKRKNPNAFFAKRFAAKEAFTKALGTGLRNGINLKDVEVYNNKLGKPNIQLKGKAHKYLKKQIKNKKYYIYLSLSDDRPWAYATVIISYN